MTRPSFSDYGTYDESAYPQLWEGVVAAWCPSLGPTGDRLHNLSRYNNWGTLTNMDPATDWVLSSGQYCLDFDGVNDYVSAANTQTFASGTQLTASIWVKRNAAGIYAELINKFTGTVAANEEGWLFRWDNANKPLFTVANNGSYGQYLATNANATTDWTHLVVVHQFGSTTQTAIYLNGAAIAASWTTGGTQIPDADGTNYPIIVGGQRYNSASFNLWAGCVDDIAVYNRVLTPNEVSQLYLLGRAGIYKRRRRTARRAAIEQAAFKAYWARRQNQIIGGGVR